jgi:hypothetical protein
VRHLLSKIAAGGLSAGVILLWWPLVFPSDTVESWLVRGVLWTLSFELMLHAFAPAEEALWRSRAARRVARQAQAASARIGTASPRRGSHARWLAAGFALFVPLALLASAPSERLKQKPVVAHVREVTRVKRILRIERRSVTVPRAAVPSAPSVASAPPVASLSSAAGPARAVAAPRRSGRPVTRRAPITRAPAKSKQPAAQPQQPGATTSAPPATAPDERSADAVGGSSQRPL